eukprot:6196992-Pleurochrysis_carterae.AAC.1
MGIYQLTPLCARTVVTATPMKADFTVAASATVYALSSTTGAACAEAEIRSSSIKIDSSVQGTCVADKTIHLPNPPRKEAGREGCSSNH